MTHRALAMIPAGLRPRRASAAVLLAIALGLTGCNKTPPRLPGPVAALVTPEAPARLVIPVDLPEPREPEPAPAEPAAPAPPPARRDPVATTRPTEKPTPPPVEAPPPVLRTTPDTSAAERQIQTLLGAAQQNLSKVNFRELSANARVQYDQARSFIRLAEDALKARNYMYAESLARRAESVARLLVKG